MSYPLIDQFKKTFPEMYDSDHYMEALFNYPENEWFLPTNKDGDHYTICSQLERAHLICTRQTPLWSNGSFKGLKFEFKYNKQLQY